MNFESYTSTVKGGPLILDSKGLVSAWPIKPKLCFTTMLGDLPSDDNAIRRMI